MKDCNVTRALLAIPRQVFMVASIRLTTKTTLTFVFRGVLSAARTDQVDVIDVRRGFSVTVDDDLLDEAVGRSSLTRRLLSHVTLRRHLELRPDVGQLRAVCACARSVEQLRRQFQLVRTLRNCETNIIIIIISRIVFPLF